MTSFMPLATLWVHFLGITHILRIESRIVLEQVKNRWKMRIRCTPRAATSQHGEIQWLERLNLIRPPFVVGWQKCRCGLSWSRVWWSWQRDLGNRILDYEEGSYTWSELVVTQTVTRLTLSTWFIFKQILCANCSAVGAQFPENKPVPASRCIG